MMSEKKLCGMVGETLTSARGAFHVFRGVRSATPTTIWLTFGDERTIGLSGASDGWHIVIDGQPEGEVDMQEAGAMCVFDLVDVAPLSDALGSVVRRVWKVVSPTRSDTIGLRLDFDAGTVRILNWGDETWIGSGLPYDSGSRPIEEVPVGSDALP